MPPDRLTTARLVRVHVTLRPAKAHRMFGAAVCVFVVFGATHARAEDAETERARALYDDAGELERRGQWNLAQQRLRLALRIRETPQLHYALGWALENDDQLLEAKVEYESAVRLGRARPQGEEAARLASERLADLEKKTPVLKVHVTGAEGAVTRVLVDGSEASRNGDVAIVRVNPGSHVVHVERGSKDSLEQMVYVGRGTVSSVEFDARDEGVERTDHEAMARARGPERSSAPATVRVAPRSEHGRGVGVVPWVLVSGGVAFLAGGTALLFSADTDANDRDAFQSKWCASTACTGTTATRVETPEAVSYREQATAAADAGNTKQAIGLALGGVGIIGAVVGAVLLLRSDNDASSAESPSPSRSAGARVRAGAAPTRGGAFATVGVAF